MERALNSDSETHVKMLNWTSGTDLNKKSLCCIFFGTPCMKMLMIRTMMMLMICTMMIKLITKTGSSTFNVGGDDDSHCHDDEDSYYDDDSH